MQVHVQYILYSTVRADNGHTPSLGLRVCGGWGSRQSNLIPTEYSSAECVGTLTHGAGAAHVVSLQGVWTAL